MEGERDFSLATTFIPMMQYATAREVARAKLVAAGVPAGAKRIAVLPYAYLRDVLERLPTQPAIRIGELLPHRCQPPDTTA